MRITQVATLADCDRCRAIAGAVWGTDAACSTAQMSVHAQYGGVVLLAWDDDLPVGFLFSFPAQYQGEHVLWSHETAVLPHYLHQGIGAELKLSQRRTAAQMGYERIAWTYDPLVARNAHFNLNKLGAQVSAYKINAYGADEDDLVNQGIETDRFIAVWPTRPEAGALAQPALADGDIVPNDTAIGGRVAGNVVTEIPLAFESLPQEDKLAWRLAFRTKATELFQQCWLPVAFQRTSTNGLYIWRQRSDEV